MPRDMGGHLPSQMGLIWDDRANGGAGGWIDPNEELTIPEMATGELAPTHQAGQTTWTFGGGPSGTEMIAQAPREFTGRGGDMWDTLGDFVTGLGEGAVNIGGNVVEGATDLGQWAMDEALDVDEWLLGPAGDWFEDEVVPNIEELIGGSDTGVEDVIENWEEAAEGTAIAITDPIGGGDYDADPDDDEEEEELPPDTDGGGGDGGIRGFGVGGGDEFEISEGLSPYKKGKLYGPQTLNPYDFSSGNMMMPQSQFGAGTVDPALQTSSMMTGRGGGISPFAAGNSWGQFGPRRTGRGFY